MGLKDLFLNKGWAGRTLSRGETAERINPIIRKHYELNHSYEHAIRHIGSREAAKTMNTLQKTARVDIGKLSETVLSAGHASFNGTDLDPNDFNIGSDDSTILDRLKDLESEFESLLSDEMELEHQIRTKAVLSVVHRNSRARLDFLRGVSRSERRIATAD